MKNTTFHKSIKYFIIMLIVVIAFIINSFQELQQSIEHPRSDIILYVTIGILVLTIVWLVRILLKN